MSIALATKGRLWPIGGLIIREQITDIRLSISDPMRVIASLNDTDRVSLVMRSDEIKATVTTDEDKEVVVSDPEMIKNTKGEC